MAFVKMSNLLGKTIEVPHGAVRAYQGLGFTVDETVAAETAEVHNEDNGASTKVPTLTEDEQFVQELEKKPLAQWSKEEIKRYAAICNVDISETKNAQEARELIKAFMDDKTA